MSPDEFLCSQFDMALNKDNKLSKQSARFKALARQHTVRLWQTTHHRADDAIKEGLKLAKQNCSKVKKGG